MCQARGKSVMCVYVVKIETSTGFHFVVRSMLVQLSYTDHVGESDQSPVFLHTCGISRCHNHPV